MPLCPFCLLDVISVCASRGNRIIRSTTCQAGSSSLPCACRVWSRIRYWCSLFLMVLLTKKIWFYFDETLVYNKRSRKQSEQWSAHSTVLLRVASRWMSVCGEVLAERVVRLVFFYEAINSERCVQVIVTPIFVQLETKRPMSMSYSAALWPRNYQFRMLCLKFLTNEWNVSGS